MGGTRSICDWLGLGWGALGPCDWLGLGWGALGPCDWLGLEWGALGPCAGADLGFLKGGLFFWKSIGAGSKSPWGTCPPDFLKRGHSVMKKCILRP